MTSHCFCATCHNGAPVTVSRFRMRVPGSPAPLRISSHFLRNSREPPCACSFSSAVLSYFDNLRSAVLTEDHLTSELRLRPLLPMPITQKQKSQANQREIKISLIHPGLSLLRQPLGPRAFLTPCLSFLLQTNYQVLQVLLNGPSTTCCTSPKKFSTVRGNGSSISRPISSMC
jgi:hypothetical protein